MNRFIKDSFTRLSRWQREWTWFIALWLVGAGTMLFLSIAIKLMIGV